MEGLSLRNLEKKYGAVFALDDVSFDVHQGEIVAVLGPSGSGKSTLLGMVAGLDVPDRGEILWDGASLTGVPPHQRNFGLMFQDFALFPHRNVYENVAFGLEMGRLPKEQIEQRVAEVLKLVGLPGFGPRDVNTLSGGEQQRVALARSLAPRPRLLMLDEPLGALDRNLRERLVVDLRQILHNSRQTAIYVTHDQEEAFALADRVAIMNHGRVEQIDTPVAMYRHPDSPFVARFLGMENLLPGDVVRNAGGYEVQTRIGTLPLADGVAAGEGPVTVLLRPDAVGLDGEGSCRLQGVVTETSFRGGSSRAVIRVNGVPLRFEFQTIQAVPAENEPVVLDFEPEKAIRLFPREEEA